ncbi:VWA domain-containing protein, partial [bacterium]
RQLFDNLRKALSLKKIRRLNKVMRFAYPYFLFLFIIVFYLIWRFLVKNKRDNNSHINYSSLSIIKAYSRGKKWMDKNKFIFILRLLILSLLIFTMARPQAGQKSEEVLTKGYEIILCLDTSSSMKAEDFKPKNRLHVAKEVVKEFIKGRTHDRIGLVVFAGIAFTQCPLTLDHGSLLEFLEYVDIGVTQTDGTAIGTAIATCAARFKNTKSKSKIVILLTDGRNNMGEVDPITAAKAAKALGVKIYTIGVGVPGGALYPVEDPIFGKRYVKIPEDLDEDTLTQIALTTEAHYFRATSKEALSSIYKRIDEMEKSEIKVKEYTMYTELYKYFLIPAFLLFLLELLLGRVLWVKLP